MCNYHKPVCVKCEMELMPTKNGISVLDYAEFGPYALWSADKWGCPTCGMEVVLGFGREPIAQHFEPDFIHMVNNYRTIGEVIEIK